MYSYGVVLWELCTLQKPFAGMSSHEHARKVRHSLFVAGATAVSQPFCREEVFKLLLSRLPSFAWLFSHPTPTKHAREYHSRTKNVPETARVLRHILSDRLPLGLPSLPAPLFYPRNSQIHTFCGTT